MRFRRFLSVLLCVVIISAMSLPVYAAESTESEVKEMTWGDTVVKYSFTPLYDMIAGVVVGAAEAIDTMTDETRENFQASVIDNLEFWKDIVDTLTYDDYVSSLDSTTVTSDVAGNMLYNGVNLPALPVWDDVTYPYAYIMGWSNGQYQLTVTNKAFYYDNSTMRITSPPNTSFIAYDVYDSTSGLTPNTLGESVSGSGTWSIANTFIFDFLWSNHVILDNMGAVYLAASDPVSASDGIESRPSSLMSAINQYNGDYSYVNNGTAVNYYIGVQNDDGTVDDLHSMAFYDEETLVFTEPTSGYQILSTGWTYDYASRTYDIAVASGTTTDMGVDVTRITASYGDEAVTMTFYLADGTEYLIEEFSYIAVSQTESALCSHSYTYETVSEPTCITPGERKYTCSICGNEYAEDVAALGHDWVLIEETDTEQTYECSVCGIQYTSIDGTSPPSDYDDGTGGSGSGSSDDESVWDKLGRLIGTLLDGIVDLFDAVLGKLLDSLINLADTISTKCTQIVDRLLTMLDDIPRLFGAFPDFLGAVFPYIPEDIMLIIEFGIAAAVFVGVLLLILKR